MRYFDCETGTGLGEYILGVPVGKVDDTWGYIIWDEQYDSIVHKAKGFKTEDEAIEAAAEYMNENYGKGAWCF